MRKEIEREAETIEQAKADIAAALGCAEDEIAFEIVQEPHKKALGLFGGTTAIVKGAIEQTESAGEAARSYLVEVLAAMGVPDPQVTMKEEDGHCNLNIGGEDLGFVIGRRGDTLDALQYLAGLAANRVQTGYFRVTVNIGDYREKREQALQGLAHKMASQAARTGRKQSLEPMNPYERRLIHTAVQEVKGATSWSVGSEPNRHVIIGPSEDNEAAKQKARSRGGKRSGGNARPQQSSGSQPQEGGKRPPRSDGEAPPRPIRQFVSRSNPLPTAADDTAPTEKTLSEKEQSATLYGRIDL